MFNIGILFIICYLKISLAQEFDVPDAKLEAFQPRGFRFSIPDEPGIKLVAFHAKVNKEIEDLEAGDIAVDIKRSKGGRWIYENRNLKLKNGDVINYWVHVIYLALGYNHLGLTWTVSEYSNEQFPYKESVESTKPAIPAECSSALTTVNGQFVCPNKLIFEENFETNSINNSVWRWQQRIADKPDYKFVSYVKKESIGFVEDHWLVIKPEVLADEEIQNAGNLEFNECTSSRTVECKMSSKGWLIFPPVRSARLSSDQSFSFKYGIMEIEAQLPQGDWLTPEIWLTPKKPIYGPIEDLNSGQIRIAFSRGNVHFVNQDGNDNGCQMIQAGILLGRSGRLVKKLPSRFKTDGCWSDTSHVFQLKWKPESLEFRVDNKLITQITPPNKGWKSLDDWNGITEEASWSSGSKMAPFDEEFFIELGVGVGGIEDFPDYPQVSKPWNNKEVKARLQFHKKKAEWLPSWSRSALKVKRIKVWSI